MTRESLVGKGLNYRHTCMTLRTCSACVSSRESLYVCSSAGDLYLIIYLPAGNYFFLQLVLLKCFPPQNTPTKVVTACSPAVSASPPSPVLTPSQKVLLTVLPYHPLTQAHITQRSVTTDHRLHACNSDLCTIKTLMLLL